MHALCWVSDGADVEPSGALVLVLVFLPSIPSFKLHISLARSSHNVEKKVSPFTLLVLLQSELPPMAAPISSSVNSTPS